MSVQNTSFKSIRNLLLATGVLAGYLLQIKVTAFASGDHQEDKTMPFYSDHHANQNFIKTLDDHFCSGCAKHCPLIAPLCLIGRKNQRSAFAAYEEMRNLSSADRAVTVNAGALAAMDVVAVVDEVMDVVAIAGLAVGGIYYLYQPIKRRTVKNEK